MFVYELEQETDFYTKYVLVPVEDCGSTFYDLEEMQELKRSTDYGN